VPPVALLTQRHLEDGLPALGKNLPIIDVSASWVGGKAKGRRIQKEPQD